MNHIIMTPFDPKSMIKSNLVDSFLGKGGLGSTKFVAFETLAWHNECFFCNICKDSMVGKGFIQVNIWVQELGSQKSYFCAWGYNG